VQDATEAYRDEMDTLGEFFSDHCVVGAGLRAFSSEIYKEYLDWAQDSGIRRPMSQTMFGLRLAERGFQKKKSTGGKIAWVGIGIKSMVEPNNYADEYAYSEYSSGEYHQQDIEKMDDDNWEGSF